MPLFGFLLLGLAVMMWFATYYEAFDYVKKRKKIIEAELPRFAVTIAHNLENDRDVVKILSLSLIHIFLVFPRQISWITMGT